MKEKLILYMHAGSGNHGCEAIVNSLCRMVQEPAVLVSYRAGEDEKYSLKEQCELIQERSFAEHKLAHILYYGYRKLTGDEESFIRYRYGKVFGKEMSPLAISIGGDNYCYDNMLSDLRLANAAFGRRGTRTVLLGCSIEPELLERSEIMEDLSGYHMIIAREPITYEALRDVFDRKGQDGAGGQGEPGRQKNPQIYCYPDPAFTLRAKKLPLPEGFREGNTVGINISPMIQEKETRSGITMENYEALLRYIIQNTDMQIALIPHVVLSQNDDRKPIHMLYERFQETGRVIEIEDASCEVLKGYIGRCRMFVGARTHATIAAYSSLVPTLVVGYSVKARGIARDLFGTEENYVVPVQSLQDKEDLVNSFRWLLSREREIRNHLEAVMPSYQEKAFLTGKEVDRLWEECSQQQKI